MKTLEEKRKARAQEYYLRKKQLLVSWLVRGRQGIQFNNITSSSAASEGQS